MVLWFLMCIYVNATGEAFAPLLKMVTVGVLSHILGMFYCSEITLLRILALLVRAVKVKQVSKKVNLIIFFKLNALSFHKDLQIRINPQTLKAVTYIAVCACLMFVWYHHVVVDIVIKMSNQIFDVKKNLWIYNAKFYDYGISSYFHRKLHWMFSPW